MRGHLLPSNSRQAKVGAFNSAPYHFRWKQIEDGLEFKAMPGRERFSDHSAKQQIVISGPPIFMGWSSHERTDTIFPNRHQPVQSASDSGCLVCFVCVDPAVCVVVCFFG